MKPRITSTFGQVRRQLLELPDGEYWLDIILSKLGQLNSLLSYQNNLRFKKLDLDLVRYHCLKSHNEIEHGTSSCLIEFFLKKILKIMPEKNLRDKFCS